MGFGLSGARSHVTRTQTQARLLDIAAAPDDGNRYELVRGELLVTPSPSPMHQRISKRLFRTLDDYFEERKIGEVFYAPLDVILTPHDVFEPDLLVVADRSHISKRGIEKPPLLVVEILSASTRKVDRGIKSRRYEELGVPHYWIVDPDERRLECFRSAEGVFTQVVEAIGDATLVHPDWAGLTIDLAALWR
jgi:Uma2 family endonuclease